jgi:hypothetical protein
MWYEDPWFAYHQNRTHVDDNAQLRFAKVQSKTRVVPEQGW